MWRQPACWLRKQIDDAIRANSKLYLGLCASSLGGCFLMKDNLGDQFDPPLALALAMRSCALSMMRVLATARFGRPPPVLLLQQHEPNVTPRKHKHIHANTNTQTRHTCGAHQLTCRIILTNNLCLPALGCARLLQRQQCRRRCHPLAAVETTRMCESRGGTKKFRKCPGACVQALAGATRTSRAHMVRARVKRQQTSSCAWSSSSLSSPLSPVKLASLHNAK
jgi:hypothetical protein